MEQRVLDWIAAQSLFMQNDNVIVALSGGADSMALFHFLYTHRSRWGLCLYAAHFEHGIRGRESKQDADFVKSVCERYGVELFSAEGNMSTREKPGGLGTETWARQLRYQFFEEIAEQCNAKVALGHTLSDNAETVLFRMARGTGPRGLGGIPPVRGRYVRPLLSVSRQEIEDYCARYQLSFCQDSTNQDNQYSRNRLRNEVLPALEKVHPGAAQSLARLAADMREVDGWLTQQAQQAMKQAACGGENPVGYKIEELLAAPAPLQLKILSLLAGDAADRASLERARRVLYGANRSAQLPGGGTAYTHRGYFYLHPITVCSEPEQYHFPMRTGTHFLPYGYEISVQTAEFDAKFENCQLFGQKSLTFAADYAKIKNSVFRIRQAGDTFAPKGRGITKSLKKWMNEQGILPHIRPVLPILADGEQVLWVCGGGFSQAVQPDSTTRQLVWIHCKEKESRGFTT